jgi:transcriptional regulator with GAF, ATPase, and Fis domain
MNANRVIRIYEVLLVFVSFVLITVTIHLNLSFRLYPQVYYVLIAIWVLFLSAVLLALYRRDIEIDTRLYVVRFAYLSALLSRELRTVSASIIQSRTSAELQEHKTQGFRTVLNLAHEYYSFIKREYCTANIVVITELDDGSRVCRIIQYDDFVPNVRREKETDIPLDNSLFAEIVRRDLRAITIDDYTLNIYPIYVTPIIDEGYCLSGICVPIKSFDEVVGFFNIDSMKRNLFKPATDERIAAFFGEVLGQLIQTVDYKAKVIDQELKS